MLPSQASQASAAVERPIVIRDTRECIPISKVLSGSDIIVLLTPVVAPPPGAPPGSADPFEILGRSISLRHPFVRHVPYTKQAGLTNTHGAFVRLAKVVIFVVSGTANTNEPSQVDLADVARIISEEKVHVVVACSHAVTEEVEDSEFETIIRAGGYTHSDLEAVASLLFAGGKGPLPPLPPAPPPPPPQWQVVVWHPVKDIQPMFDLWSKAIPRKFHLNRFMFGNILRRDGWSKHFVVREQSTGDILGYSATYTTYADSDPDTLVGSLAMVIVHPDFRNRGIGTLLHNHALSQLRKTRGVRRLQLGSTFPRLLYGLPVGPESTRWFANRGWDIDIPLPGQGFPVSDWLLHFDHLPQATIASLPGVRFRPCGFAEFQKVIDMVRGITKQHTHMMGWYDQYTKLAGTPNIQDVIVGVMGERIVAAAITYETSPGSPTGQDMPWPGTIGSAVGGVTCACIPDTDESVPFSRDALMIRLLDGCIKQLRSQNCQALLIDSIRGGHEGFQSLGFEEWAQYKEVWKNV